MIMFKLAKDLSLAVKSFLDEDFVRLLLEQDEDLSLLLVFVD